MDHEIKIANNAFLNFNLMIEVSISWSKLSNINEQIQPHEQIEFWPHNRKFDLLKKLNFDLMKLDLLTPTLHLYNLFSTVFSIENHPNIFVRPRHNNPYTSFPSFVARKNALEFENSYLYSDYFFNFWNWFVNYNETLSAKTWEGLIVSKIFTSYLTFFNFYF